MSAALLGAAGVGGVLGWWCGGFLPALPARVPPARPWLLVRTSLIVVAVAVAAGLDILALAGPAPAVTGLAALVAALALRALVVAGLRERSREGGTK